MDNIRYERLLKHLHELGSRPKVIELFTQIYEHEGIEKAYQAYLNILTFRNFYRPDDYTPPKSIKYQWEEEEE